MQVTAAGKAILITGCDSRVGYALAKQLDELVYVEYNNICCLLKNLKPSKVSFLLRVLLYLLDLIIKPKTKKSYRN
jgi:hypothetical protein